MSLARTLRPCARSIPKHLGTSEIIKNQYRIKYHTVRYWAENHEFVGDWQLHFYEHLFVNEIHFFPAYWIFIQIFSTENFVHVYLGTGFKTTFPLLSIVSSRISNEARNLIGPSDGRWGICCWLFDDWPELDVCCCNCATVACIACPINDVVRREIDTDDWFPVADVWLLVAVGVVRRNAFAKLSKIL